MNFQSIGIFFTNKILIGWIYFRRRTDRQTIEFYLDARLCLFRPHHMVFDRERENNFKNIFKPSDRPATHSLLGYTENLAPNKSSDTLMIVSLLNSLSFKRSIAIYVISFSFVSGNRAYPF